MQIKYMFITSSCKVIIIREYVLPLNAPSKDKSGQLDFLKTLYLSKFYFQNRKGNNMSKSLEELSLNM